MGLSSPDRRRLWLLGVVILLASAARALLLVVKPIWHDELFTLWVARRSSASLWEALRYDSGPPLFYWLEKPFVWLGEALSRDEAARLLPFLVILLLFVGAFSLKPQAPRFRFVILLAVSPLLLIYSAEARAYGVLAAADFGVFLLLFRYRPTAARLCAAAFLVAFALWTHYLAIFFVVSAAFLLMLRRRWKPLAAILAGSLLFAPWLPILTAQPVEATTWMREPVGKSVVGLLSALGGAGRIPDPLGGPLPDFFLWIAAAVGLLAVLVLTLKGDEALRDPIALVLLTTCLVIAASFKRSVAFAGRSEMAVLPLWLWVMAQSSIGNRAMRWVVHASVACALMASVSILAVHREEPDPSRATAVIAGLAQKDDLVIAAASFYLPARLAHDRGELAAPVLPLPQELARHPGWFTADIPQDADYRVIEMALARLMPNARAFALLPPAFRTARFASILGARGVVRVMSERPQTVVLVCTAR